MSTSDLLATRSDRGITPDRFNGSVLADKRILTASHGNTARNGFSAIAAAMYETNRKVCKWQF